MRGGEDRAAANQRETDALNLARTRAVAECRGRLEPRLDPSDRRYPEPEVIQSGEQWDRLNVEYLRAEWPAARLC